MADNKLHIDIVASDKASGSIARVGKSLSGLKKSALLFTKAATAVGSVYGIFKSIGLLFDTLTSNAKQDAVLKTITASSEEFKKSSDFINKISGEFSFASDEITRAFVFLRKKGLDPLNTNILYSLGDAAAAMGISLDQASNAVGHAMMGEFSYLKSLGISSHVHGNAVDFVYYDKNNQQHVRRVANRNNPELTAAVIDDMFSTKYANTMKNIKNSWAGIKTGMASTTSNALNLITAHPVFDRILKSLLDFMKNADDSLNNGKLKQATTLVGDFFNAIYDFVALISGLIRTVWNYAVSSTIDAYNTLTSVFPKGVSDRLSNYLKDFANHMKIYGVFFDTFSARNLVDYADSRATTSKSANIKVDFSNLPHGADVQIDNVNNLFEIETEMSYSYDVAR